MSAVIVNLLIGLATSVASGACVWLWQRARKSLVSRRKAAFFGLQPGITCRIVMNHKWNMPGSTHQDDVHAMIEIAVLAAEVGARVTVTSCDSIREGNAGRTEFCVGGPSSNPRTAGYLASFLPGVTVAPFRTAGGGPGAGDDAGAFIVGGERFLYERGRHEHAIVAKFTPAAGGRPVVLVCGQTAITNRAAVHLLKRDHRRLTRALGRVDRFCLVIRVTSPGLYGHEMAEIAGDVSDAAFAPARPGQRAGSAGGGG